MDYPLLCFPSQTLEASVTRILGFTERFPPEPIKVEEISMRKWKHTNDYFYSCVVTVSGGTRGMLMRVNKLGVTFRGPVLYFAKSVSESMLRNSGVLHMQRLVIVKRTEDIQSSLGLILDGEQSFLLHDKLFAPPSRGGRRRFEPREDDESTRDQISFADRFVEAMQEGRHIEAPRQLMHDGIFLHNPHVYVAPHATFVLQDADANDDEDVGLQNVHKELDE